MIYDFGCSGPSDFLTTVFNALPGAAAAWTVIAGLAFIGAWLNRSKQFKAEDIFTGWGVVAGVMTLTAVLFTKALPFAALLVFAFIILTAVSIFRERQRYFSAPFWFLAFFPGLLVLALINVSGITKWDDFSHWVPNALYLYAHEDVPGLGLPADHSVWPGYPYALPFLTYLASTLLNGFLVQGGAMINFLLLIAFAAMLTRDEKLNLRGIGLTALALFFVTLGNPSFNASFTVTSQGDTGSMVLLGALGLMLWRELDVVRANKGRVVTPNSVALALTAVAFVLIKQSNVVMLAILTIAYLMMAWRNGLLAKAVVPLVVVLLPALLLRLSWGHYVSAEVAGNGFSVRPLAEWRFDLLPALLEAQGAAILKKNGHFGLMLIITGFGIWNFFRAPTPLRNLTVLVGLTYLGYLTFLTTMYVGATFGEDEIRRAASFYRYATHAGLMGIAVAWIAVPEIWKKYKKQIKWPDFKQSQAHKAAHVVLIVCLLPIALLIKTSWLVPQPSQETCDALALGHELAVKLPDQTRMGVIEPESDGLLSQMINFQFAIAEANGGRSLTVKDHFDRIDQSKLPNALETIQKDGYNAIFVPQAKERPLKILGYDNAKGPLLLLLKEKRWTKVN